MSANQPSNDLDKSLLGPMPKALLDYCQKNISDTEHIAQMLFERVTHEVEHKIADNSQNTANREIRYTIGMTKYECENLRAVFELLVSCLKISLGWSIKHEIRDCNTGITDALELSMVINTYSVEKRLRSSENNIHWNYGPPPFDNLPGSIGKLLFKFKGSDGIPIICTGEKRYGRLYEPLPDEYEWRPDAGGIFVQPLAWAILKIDENR